MRYPSNSPLPEFFHSFRGQGDFCEAYQSKSPFSKGDLEARTYLRKVFNRRKDKAMAAVHDWIDEKVTSKAQDRG